MMSASSTSRSSRTAWLRRRSGPRSKPACPTTRRPATMRRSTTERRSRGRRTPSSGDLYHDFAASGAADTFDRMEIAPGQTLDCVLQWTDPWGASSNDYDLELWDLDQNPAKLLEASTNVQSGAQDPHGDHAPAQPGGHSAPR